MLESSGFAMSAWGYPMPSLQDTIVIHFNLKPAPHRCWPVRAGVSRLACWLIRARFQT